VDESEHVGRTVAVRSKYASRAPLGAGGGEQFKRLASAGRLLAAAAAGRRLRGRSVAMTGWVAPLAFSLLLEHVEWARIVIGSTFERG
jgi:hypothetical protein